MQEGYPSLQTARQNMHSCTPQTRKLRSTDADVYAGTDVLLVHSLLWKMAMVIRTSAP